MNHIAPLQNLRVAIVDKVVEAAPHVFWPVRKLYCLHDRVVDFDMNYLWKILSIGDDVIRKLFQLFSRLEKGFYRHLFVINAAYLNY